MRTRFFFTGLLFHNDIYEFTGNINRLYDLLASDRRFHFFIGERAFDDHALRGIGGHYDAAAQFTIHLHRDFKFLFLGESGIVFWPGSLSKLPFSPIISQSSWAR